MFQLKLQLLCAACEEPRCGSISVRHVAFQTVRSHIWTSQLDALQNRILIRRDLQKVRTPELECPRCYKHVFRRFNPGQLNEPQDWILIRPDLQKARTPELESPRCYNKHVFRRCNPGQLNALKTGFSSVEIFRKCAPLNYSLLVV